jgi:hypothetical protein
MDIEERLFRFSPQAALHAWRLFRLRTEGKRLVLSSPMYHDDTTALTPLWPHPEAEAACHKGHPAPAPGCRCGIYGAVAGALDSLPGYLCDTAYEHDPWAYAEIACYGRVFVDMRGVRAEHARLLRIALPGSGCPGGAAPDEAARTLRDRYGVPVRGLECVPEWLTANVRPGGPPPGSESLNLDLARLDLSCRGDRTEPGRDRTEPRRAGLARDHEFGVGDDNHGWAPDVGASGPGADRGAGHKAWEAQDTQDAATDRGDSSSS